VSEESSQTELNHGFPQLDAGIAEVASGCAKSDRSHEELDAVFTENKGVFAKEASVYA
jgi:hypothetical protein